jgi:hypothetical protein
MPVQLFGGKPSPACGLYLHRFPRQQVSDEVRGFGWQGRGKIFAFW